MKRILSFLCVPFALFALAQPAAGRESRSLDIYFLDMFGGGSTLIVTPLGESVLIDTGSLRPEHRDADRILRACEDAGLKQIDYLVTTHFHSDHFGAILEVSQRIPVKCFMDKGSYAPAGDGDSRWAKGLYELYEQATQGKVTTVRTGDDVPLKNDPTGKLPPIRLHCVAAEKKVEGFDGDVDTPVIGFAMGKIDATDNARSIALLLTCGSFRFFAGGDITWNVEHHLVHPINRIGKVDLYQVTHHGWDQSNNTLLLQALDPTVAVAMNGPRKGIQPRTFQDLTALPSLKGLYQIHFNIEHDGRYNTKPEFIANPKDNPDKGVFIKASVHADKGVFTLQIGPNGERRTYPIQSSLPDLSRCTRLEVDYGGMTLEHFFELPIRRGVLNSEELEYVRSLKTIAVTDPEVINALAREVSTGRPIPAPPGPIAGRNSAGFACYAGDTRRARLIAVADMVLTENGQWFKCDAGLQSAYFVPSELRSLVSRADCVENLSQLYGFFRLDFAHASEKAPVAGDSEWCDVLMPRDSQIPGAMTKRLAFHSKAQGKCDYAMNANWARNCPPDLVVLFEARAGWNQCGGPELFTFDNHDPQGGCVLLNDGTVRFIRTPEELRQLRWK